MKMNNNKINKAANILYNSRINLQRIKALPEDCKPKSLKEAYSIQDALTKKYLTSDNNIKLIGKKIGCTNKAAQVQLNIKGSFFGNIFSNNISKSNCKINPKQYFSPFIEPEFSFVMKEELDISKAPYSPDVVSEFILEVLPSIELVDSRYEDWTKIGVNNLVADNAVHAHWIFGNSFKEINIFDFKNHSVNLYINDKLIEKGNSSNVMGNPINSLTWLINNLASIGKSLPKNYYVSTGTCTKAIPIFKGDIVKADFGNLGNVDFVFKE
tara:strand:+ start:993 stop:1799 length:807 start_codon:yes stop_codon:yes gene_type:complete